MCCQIALLTSYAKVGTQVTMDAMNINPVQPSAEANCAFVMAMPYLTVGDSGRAYLDQSVIPTGGKCRGWWRAGGHPVTSDQWGNIVLAVT